MRRRLEIAAAAIASPLENNLRAQLVDIIRSAQAEEFESFRRLMNQTSNGPDASTGPSQTDAPIIAEPAGPNLLSAPEPLEQYWGVDDTVNQDPDLSAYLHQPVMGGDYGVPEALELSSEETRLRSEHSVHGPDSGYGSNTGNHHGEALEPDFAGWGMPFLMEQTFDC